MNNIHRIAFVHGEFPFGGAERVTIDIAEYLKDKNYEIFVFTTDFHEDKMPVGHEAHMKIIRLPENDVAKSRKDIDVICRNIREYGIETAVVVARDLKHVREIRKTGCRLVYAHHSIPFHEARATIDRIWRRGTRNPLRFLTWMLLSWPKYVLLGKARRMEMDFYRRSYTEYDRYVMLCEEYRNEIIKRLALPQDEKKIKVIWNSEHLPEKINLSKKKIFLYSGRLSYADKRLDRLIRAWNLASRKLPEWQLVIAGEGKDRRNLERLVRKTRTERVTFTGFVNDMDKYYSEASFCVLTSTYEGWGLCLSEGQANGVIPIAFNSFAGARHIIAHNGEDGFLVKPFDIEAFADTMISVAQIPEEELRKMRLQVINKARHEYAPERVGELWKRLFEDLAVSC